MPPYEGVPVTQARGRWAAGLCACWSSPMCVLPFISACAPCVPMARAAHRAGVGRYYTVLGLTGTLVILLLCVPSPRMVEEYLVTMDTNVSLAELMPNATTAIDEGRLPASVELIVVDPTVRYYLPLAWSIVYWTLVAVLSLVAVVLRLRLVRRYQIQENPCISLLLVAACTGCAVAQQQMHVDLVEVGSVQHDCGLGPDHPKENRATNANVEML